MFPPLWHRFTFLTFSSFLLMLSRICFLIFPIYCFDGLINLHIGLFSKLSLWSFKVMKVSFVAVISTRSSIRSFSVIVLLCRQFCLIGCSLYFCRFLWCCHAGAYCTLWLPICRSSWIYWPIKIGCCHFQLISCLHWGLFGIDTCSTFLNSLLFIINQDLTSNLFIFIFHEEWTIVKQASPDEGLVVFFLQHILHNEFSKNVI